MSEDINENTASEIGNQENESTPIRTTKQVGDLLEDAVREIEGQLIEKYTVPERSEIIITPKYIYKLNGAPREVDLHIHVKDGGDFDRIFIYECKNWKAKVTPQEIAYFQKKIIECGAAKGFFIAKGFTQGCYDEAENDNRLELLKATELQLDPASLISIASHYLVDEPKIFLTFFGENNVQIPVEADFTIEGIDNVVYDRVSFAESLFKVNEEIESAKKRLLALRQEGITPFRTSNSVDILPSNRFIYKDTLVVKIAIDIFINFYYTTSKIISHFDIEKRGRVLRQVMFNHLGDQTDIIIRENVI